MTDPATLTAFLAASLLLNVTPGPDMLFCLGQGLRGGPSRAWAASAGVSLGGMVHVTAAGLGLAALVAAEPRAFAALRWIGVAYLVRLGIGAIREALAGGHGPRPVAALPASLPGAFLQGLAVNLTNPKYGLFVLAFLPQFADPSRPLLAQFLFYGAIMSAGGLVVNGAIGSAAGGLGRRVAGSGRGGRMLGLATGTLFLGLAARLATQRT